MPGPERQHRQRPAAAKYKERLAREGGALGLTTGQNLVSYPEGLYLGGR